MVGGFTSEDNWYPWLKEKLGAQVTVLENKGHFTGDDGVVEIPEILQLIS